MNQKTIIGLTGQMASGKGAIAEYLKDKYNAEVIQFSTVFREILERLHLEINRNNMSGLSTILREKFGEDLISKVVAEDVKKLKNNVVVVDGIRRIADIDYLKEQENFKLIRVVADSKIRYNRLVDRNQNKGDNKKTYEEFLADEQLETEQTIAKVMEQAEIEIDNNKDFDSLYKQVKLLLK